MKKLFRKIFRAITAPFRWLGRLFLKTPLGQLFGPDPEDTPISDTITKALDSPRTFWEGLVYHLIDLRKAVFKSVAVLVLASVVAFIYIKEIMAWLGRPLGPDGLSQLNAIAVTEPISVVMRITLIAGLAVSLPYIAFQVLVFVGPGISRKARMMGLVGLPFVLVFFAAGAYFTYAVMLPPALVFLSNFEGLQSNWTYDSYFSIVTGLMFWLGIIFEFPLVAFILSSMGILKPETLKDQWRLATILLTILAAVITPTPDPINWAIVFVPMMVLYWLSVVLAYVARGRRKKRTDSA